MVLPFQRISIFTLQSISTMMRTIFTTMLLWVFLPVIISGQTIDETQSQVSFKISNMWVNTVKGTIKGMQGKLEFDKDNLSAAKFNVCINPATIDTDNEERDADLRSENYFHVEKYPSICFVSKEIIKTEEGYLTRGDLTLHGVTKPIEIPFTFDGNTLKGTLTIDRFDYNIGEDTGKFMMGSEAELEITCTIQP
jgi:polyisoprenoid-binding protein YceI